MGDNKKSVTITVNGDVYRLGVGNAVGDIAPADTLAETSNVTAPTSAPSRDSRTRIRESWIRCSRHLSITPLFSADTARRESS